MNKGKKNKTPKLANWLLSKLVDEGLLEEFLGDLQESHQDRILVQGKFKAKLMYWVDTLHLLLGFTSLNVFKNLKPTIMYKHYLTIARRNFLRNKWYSLVNLGGLAIGMGVCLLICQYIYFELSYDQFHPDVQNTYRVLIDETKNDVDQGVDLFTGYAFGINAKEEIPEIKQLVRVKDYGINTVITNQENDKAFNEDGLDILFVDSTFLQVFDFPLKLGNKESVFEEEFNIVLTEKAARRYFGSDNPIGKSLKISGPPSPGEYIVSGVLENLPVNSHLQFEFLLPMNNFLKLAWGGAVMKNGGLWESFVTYFTLQKSADITPAKEKLDQLIVQYKGQINANSNIVETAILQPVIDIHLKSAAYDQGGFVTNEGNVQNVRIFSIIAFFMLLIAWINYINLSTARSITRAKEVGIRKSIGAQRKQLIGQFITESFLVNLIAAFLAVVILIVTLPLLNHLIGKELDLSLLQIPIFWISFLVVIIIGSLLSGLYPAFVLSAFQPTSILGAYKVNRGRGLNLRSGLIIFQFLTSLSLISGTYLIYKQITFMKNQELGIDIEKIMVLKGPKILADNTNHPSTFQAFREEVRSHHSIAAVTGSVLIPSQVKSTEVDNIRKVGAPLSSGQSGRGIFTGLDFPNTYGIELIAGTWFTEDMSNLEPVVVINEEAVRMYGLGSPEQALQESLIISDDDVNVFRIIGVVKNFHWHSLKDAHTPYLFSYEGGANDYISFRINLSDIPASLVHIKSTYDSFYPDNPFEYFFLDDEFNRQYQSDLQFGNLFLAFTTLAIFIACIGLLALVSFSATSRIKEIGIRKVLGASISNLMLMLSKEYLILLLLANVLGIPVILFWGSIWLDNYAFRIRLNLEHFLIPSLVLLIIALFTVSYRTYTAATTNPVESLKTE